VSMMIFSRVAEGVACPPEALANRRKEHVMKSRTRLKEMELRASPPVAAGTPAGP